MSFTPTPTFTSTLTPLHKKQLLAKLYALCEANLRAGHIHTANMIHDRIAAIEGFPPFDFGSLAKP